MNDFYLTLSSSTSEFTTRLAEPVELKENFQVALVEITFLKKEPDRTLALYSVTGPVKERYDVEKIGHTVVPKADVETINACIESLLPLEVKRVPYFTVDDKTLRFFIGSLNNGGRLFVQLADSISMGFRNYEARSAACFNRRYVTTSFIESDIKPNHCIHVFTDVVNRHLAGDQFLPLLRVVPISSQVEADELCATQFRYPIYLPVDRSFIQDIRVSISNPFKEGFIVLVLHFKSA